MAYDAAARGSLPVRSPQVRPVHVADLLSREGHPLAAHVLSARDRHDPKQLVEQGFSPRRSIGVAAGAALVFGAVVAGALGLNHPPQTHPTASGAEPVGALPSKGAPAGKPAEVAPPPAAPGDVAAPVEQPFVNTAATERAPQQSTGRAGQIGLPASLPAPKAPTAKPPVQQQPTQQTPPAQQQQQQAPAPGPLQAATQPVTQAVGGTTLSGAVAPVTSTVDNTLQPALSLIGGLLGH